MGERLLLENTMKLLLVVASLANIMTVRSLPTTTPSASALPDTNFSWTWPFGHPDLCKDNPADGLPDYFGPRYMDPGGRSFKWNTIACPKELIQTCRTPPPADPHGFPVLEAGKDCDGGFTCRNAVSYIQKEFIQKLPADQLPSWVTPNIKVKNYTLPQKGLRITRRYMLQRAIGWVASHTPYHGHGTKRNDYEFCAAPELGEDPNCPQYNFV